MKNKKDRGSDKESLEIRRLCQEYESFQTKTQTAKNEFSNYPISQKTLKGLRESNFLVPTDIQRESIIPALIGKNVVGVSETGSGKTLAFLIPVLEHLFVNKWSRAVGGLAALIISPTRELAYQLFETLRKIGKYHDFSAALVIGGKNLRFERNRMDQCNILICTPGRLLQHMDENPTFNADNLEVLVIDEADRCLDMGFEPIINAILKNLPLQRQTLLFTATLNNSDYLERLNVQNPVFVGKNWKTNTPNVKLSAIPEHLNQNYVVVELENKITMLWSFIKNHLKQKIIVFFSSCKQVKYVYETFCKLRPGIGLLAIYGTLSQDRRISVYNEFFKRNHVVLFATDIASRGLDFPDVNWIVQLDCPEDVTQYIHRAGRSARNKSHGESLLILTPSEETGMIQELKSVNINLRKIEVDPKKLFSQEGKLKSLCARSPELKLCAQRAFIAYIKSVFIMKNKSIFDLKRLNLEKFAESLGLVTAPKIRFLNQHLPRQKSNFDDSNTKSSKEEEEDDEEDFLTLKRIDHPIKNENNTIEIEDDHTKQKKKIKTTKAAVAKKSVKKKIAVNKRKHYDDDGNEINEGHNSLHLDSNQDSSANGLDIVKAKRMLLEEDVYDKQRFREQVKLRHKKQKEKRKQRANSSDSDKESSSVETDEDCATDEDDGQKQHKIETPKNQNRISELSKNIKSLEDVENIASLLLNDGK